MRRLATLVVFGLGIEFGAGAYSRSLSRTPVRRGCCSHHEGVCSCQEGSASCCDGSLSPTYECD
jgi:hypothetical protein